MEAGWGLGEGFCCLVLGDFFFYFSLIKMDKPGCRNSAEDLLCPRLPPHPTPLFLSTPRPAACRQGLSPGWRARPPQLPRFKAQRVERRGGRRGGEGHRRKGLSQSPRRPRGFALVPSWSLLKREADPALRSGNFPGAWKTCHPVRALCSSGRRAESGDYYRHT